MSKDGIVVVDQWERLGHTRAKHWLYRVWDPRRRAWKSKAFAKKEPGVAWADDLRSRFNQQLASAGKLPFAIVVDDYLAAMNQRGLRDVHVREAELVCRAVIAAGADDLHRDDFAAKVRAWLAAAETFAPGRTGKVSNVTKNRWLRLIKSACLHAVRHHGLRASPLHSVKPLKVDQVVKATLRLDELRSLVGPATGPLPPEHGPADPYFLPASLMVYGGLRVGEAHHVRWEWIDFAARTLTIRVRAEYRLKRNRERVVPLLDELRDILWRWPWRRRDGWLIADDAARARDNKAHWLAFRAYLVRCGLAKRDLHPHATRHTWASMMLATGASPMLVRRALGHSSLVTTDEYSNAEAAFGAVVKGWARGQFYLRRSPPRVAAEDPLAFLREHLAAGGDTLADLASAAAVPVDVLAGWLRDGPPEPVRQLVAVRAAVARTAD